MQKAQKVQPTPDMGKIHVLAKDNLKKNGDIKC